MAMAQFQRAEPAQEAIPTTIGAAYTLLSQLAQGAFGR
jgi:hypothetical protein